MKIIFLAFLFFAQTLSANFLEISLNTKKETTNDFLFLEPLDSNTSKGYEKLSNNSQNSNINLYSNFNDMIGINYTKSLSGIEYDAKEIYLGSKTMKYLSFKTIQKDIDYGLRDTKKTIDEYTVFNIFKISKEKLSSSKVETLDVTLAALHPLVTAPININRNYSLETFSLSSENLYQMVEEDLLKGEEYLNPIMFSKQINSNFSIYGVAILSFVQYNYTSIDNYYNTTDANATRTSVSYGAKTTDGVSILDQSKATTSSFFLSGKYRGYEYGYKISAQYKVKQYALLLTAYNKQIAIKNKFTTVDAGKTSTDTYNVLFHQDLSLSQEYINLEFKYNF
jgi:hypothetical protein